MSRKEEMREGTVATATDRASAEFLVEVLADPGIPARIVSATGIEPSWTVGNPTAVNALRIQVLERHLEPARAVLEEARAAADREPGAQ